MPELGLTGEAILTDIQTTPEIEAPLDSRDERQVVTATFHHSSGDVIDLVVADSPGERLGLLKCPPREVQEPSPAESGQPNKEIRAWESEISDFKSPPCDFPKTENLNRKTSGEAETIGTTSNHPFWSEDRQEFVQAGSLEIGERLQTLSGDVKVVQQKLPRPGPQPVFNLEVHDEHVYFVGEDGVLVHNACNEWNEFLAANKGRFAGADWQEQASSAYFAAKVQDLAKGDNVPRVFWSGGTIAKRSAAGFARKMDGTKLEMPERWMALRLK